MAFIISTDFFVNGEYCGNTHDKERLGVVRAIANINKGVKTGFLCKFSTAELRKYLTRLTCKQ